jgi:hemerythrin
MRYEWDESMSTGVEDLDNEHRTLIQWVNRLSDAVEAGTAEAEVPKILAFLGTYAARHFAHEEECMVRFRCPAGEANRKAHEQFNVQFTVLKNECLKDGVTPERVAKLQGALGSWLAEHIMKVDVALRPCVR